MFKKTTSLKFNLKLFFSNNKIVIFRDSLSNNLVDFVFFSDPESISKWKTTVTILSAMIEVCKRTNNRPYLLLFVRYVPQVIRMFLSKGMPILDHNLKYQREDVQNIVQSFQSMSFFTFLDIFIIILIL